MEAGATRAAGSDRQDRRTVGKTSQADTKVNILLATYQGERFIEEQLATIAEQTVKAWKLYVSDDGSSDETLRILSEFADRSDRKVTITPGPCSGFQRNFMHLLATVPLDAEYYAFTDQDDRWLPDKLERAIAWLDSHPTELPLLYCSRTLNIDEKNREIGYSPLFREPPSFANALVQSIAGGNTMVFNRKLLEIVRQIGTAHAIPSHDWWLYIVASGMSGRIRYDPSPNIAYRQHGRNQVGANSTFIARLRRLRMLKNGRFRSWNDQHVAALETCRQMLDQQSRQKFDDFKEMRARRFPMNLYFLRKGRFHRQTLAGQLGLFVGVIFHKI